MKNIAKIPTKSLLVLMVGMLVAPAFPTAAAEDGREALMPHVSILATGGAKPVSDLGLDGTISCGGNFALFGTAEDHSEQECDAGTTTLQCCTFGILIQVEVQFRGTVTATVHDHTNGALLVFSCQIQAGGVGFCTTQQSGTFFVGDIAHLTGHAKADGTFTNGMWRVTLEN